jgi:hypothetical protein
VPAPRRDIDHVSFVEIQALEQRSKDHLLSIPERVLVVIVSLVLVVDAFVMSLLAKAALSHDHQRFVPIAVQL